jgi:DNA-binding NarL/FixJ family response regulator
LPPKRPLNAHAAPTGFSTGNAQERIDLIEDKKKSTSQVLGEALVAKAKQRLDSDMKNAKARRAEARRLWREGASIQQIIKKLKASETTVRRYIKGARRPKSLAKK